MKEGEEKEEEKKAEVADEYYLVWSRMPRNKETGQIIPTSPDTNIDE